jgi:predicted transcriptional regulator
MEVRLDPDMQSKLTRLAAQQGRNTEALVQEAIARLIDDDEWFIRESSILGPNCSKPVLVL